MAITFIDKQTLDYAWAQALAFTIPASAQEDDLMMAFVKQSENTGAEIWDDDWGWWNGWTRLAYNRSTAWRDQETAVYYKIHSWSESNPTFTWNSGGTNEPMSWALLVYRWVNVASPIANYSYLFDDNAPNVDPSAVTVDYDNSTIIVFQAVTHDDITEVGMPTWFTNRSQVWNWTADDHRNHFVCDITGISAGNYDPPAFTHTVSANTPESQVYTIALNEPQAIGVWTYDTTLNWGDVNKTVTGYGFEASQWTGKVEFWSDTTGTIKQTQSIDSWSDTSIQFDTTKGSLSDDQINYIVITNDNWDATQPKAVSFWLATYELAIWLIEPDHLWLLDNSYDDTGYYGWNPMTQSVVWTHPWTDWIVDWFSKSMQFDDIADRRECPDSANMNVTIDSAERTVAGWIQLWWVQKSMGAIWKEWGWVQNLAFLMWLWNVLLAQWADTPWNAINAQASSNIKLTPNRPYHIALRYSLTESPKELRLYLDWEEQWYVWTNWNPLWSWTFNSHSWDITWWNSDNNLETWGTDIAYAGQEDCKYNAWCSWSDNSSVWGALHKTDHIRDVLFRRWAKPKYIIDDDTESNMQTDLDNQLQNSEVEDYPLWIRIFWTWDITLTANNITFNSRTSLNIEWRWTGELTWIVGTWSDIDESKCIATKWGTINIIRPYTVTVWGMEDGSKVTILDASDDSVIWNIESSSWNFKVTTQASSVHIIVIDYDYNVIQKFDVPVTSDTFVPIIQETDYTYNNPI